jgi:hypothetical protein
MDVIRSFVGGQSHDMGEKFRCNSPSCGFGSEVRIILAASSIADF